MKKSIQMLFAMIAVLSIGFAGCVAPEPTESEEDEEVVKTEQDLECYGECFQDCIQAHNKNYCVSLCHAICD